MIDVKLMRCLVRNASGEMVRGYEVVTSLHRLVIGRVHLCNAPHAYPKRVWCVSGHEDEGYERAQDAALMMAQSACIDGGVCPICDVGRNGFRVEVMA